MTEFVDLSGIELAVLSIEEVKELADRLKNMRLKCVGLHSVFPSGLNLVGKDCDPDRNLSYFREIVKRANILGVKYIGIGSPGSRMLSRKADKSEADLQMIHILRTFCMEAGKTKILLESLNKRETNYINTLDEAYNIIDKVGKKNAGLVLDLYHFLLEGEVITNIRPKIWNRIYYVHIADPKTREYPGKSSCMKLKTTLLEALKKTNHVCEIAVEAKTEDFLSDAAISNQVIRQWIEEEKSC